MKLLEGRLAPLRTRLDELVVTHGIDLNPALEHPIPDLQTLDEVLVWGHDPFVEPGKTYRYRATVHLYNPFFGKQPFLQDDQKELARQAALDVQTTPWSEPVSIEGHTRFFFTKATADDGRLDIGAATVEIFRLYDGVWYKNDWTVQPGDPLGETIRLRDAEGNPIQVSFDTNAYVQDILRTPVEDERTGATRTPHGRVVVVRADGTMEVREPNQDTSSRQRHKLLTYTQDAERHADAR